MAVREMDLSFLSIAERDEIMKVLDRDNLVRQNDEKRIRILKNVKTAIDTVKFKLLTGEWIHKAKKQSDRDHGRTTEIIRKSFRKLYPRKDYDTKIVEGKEIDLPKSEHRYDPEMSAVEITSEQGLSPDDKIDEVQTKEQKHGSDVDTAVFQKSSEDKAATHYSVVKHRRPRFRSASEVKPSSLQEILATLSSTSPSHRRRYLSTPGRVSKPTLKITEEEKAIFDALVIRDPIDETKLTDPNKEDFFTIKHKHEVDMNAVRDIIRKETIMTTGTKPPVRRKRIEDPISYKTGFY